MADENGSLWANNNNMKPYLIRTPDFDPSSGGIRVMYGLYGALLLKGQLAYLNSQINSESVGIYPEIYHGNDMFATNVVRYILQKPGMMQTGGLPGPEAFDPKDDLWGFSRLFIDLPEDRYMFLPILDTHLFINQHKKRTKKMFFVGKGVNRGKHPTEAVELPRMHDQQLLADLMNECEVLYIYDPVTAMSEIARLCGCRVVMLDPMEGFADKYEPGCNGISFSVEKPVKLDYSEFQAHYLRMKREFLDKLDYFIDLTQK